MPRRGQLASLVIRAPEIQFMAVTDAIQADWEALVASALAAKSAAGGASASFPKGTYATTQHQQWAPQALVLKTQRLEVADMGLNELRRLKALCRLVIRGYGDVQRPEVDMDLTIRPEASQICEELRAML